MLIADAKHASSVYRTTDNPLTLHPAISHPRMILIRIHSGELFAINGRKCPLSTKSKIIDGPVYDGAHN